MKIDPILAAILQRRLKSITEEMGLVMLRTARSPILSEARDFVTGLYDARGRMLEQTEYVPILAFAVPPALQRVIEYFGDDVAPGDVIMHNDPFNGGNQLADVKVIKPIFYDDKLIAWAVINGHQADIGGANAGGYNPAAREVWQEGLRIPPVKVYAAGKLRRDVWDLVFANIRFPIVAEDIQAAIGGCAVGERQLTRLVERYGWETFAAHTEYLFNRTEAMVRAEIAAIPDGVYTGTAWHHFDSITDGTRMKIQVQITVAGDQITFDYTGTSPQTPGFVNAPFASTASATLLTFLMCLGADIPRNDGLTRSVRIEVPAGSFLNARFPAATTLGNRLSDQISAAIFRALAPVLPERVTADWNATLAPAIVGRDPRYNQPYVDICFLAAKGGGGALKGLDGYDHIGMIGCGGGILAQDPEMFELKDPHLLLHFEFARDSAGAGQWRGGLGVETIMELQGENMMITTHGSGVEEGTQAAGLFGGGRGVLNRGELIYPDGARRVLKSKEVVRDIPRGSRLHQVAGGGGGYGPPWLRPAEKVAAEVAAETLSPERAKSDYGVVIVPGTGAIDHAATEALRAQMAAAGGISET